MNDHDSVLGPDEKVCPFCAETIKKAAVKCRYCQSELPAGEVLAPPPPVPIEEPPVEENLEDLEEPDAEPAVEEPRGRRRLDSGRLTVALVVLCLVLGGAAFAAWWWGPHHDDDKVADAVGSAQARDAGIQQAATLTKQVLSYDWKTLDKDIAASEKVLAPSFRSEYAKTMQSVHAQTIKNQVSLQATVVSTSTVTATKDEVVALVFVNQTTKATGTKNTRLDQNRVLVTLTRHGGEWRVSKMDAF
jgi:hypothetical protein